MLNARRQYQRHKQEWEQNLLTLEQEAQTATAEAQDASQPAQGKLLAAARLKQQQFVNYRQSDSQQQPAEMERLTQPVLERVNKFLYQYGSKHHYDVVFAASESGGIVYANPGMDVTMPVVAELNQALRDSLHTK